MLSFFITYKSINFSFPKAHRFWNRFSKEFEITWERERTRNSMFAHAYTVFRIYIYIYIFESTRDYAKYNGMIVLSQILGRLKSGTAKDRYDKNCTRFPMQRVLNVKKETLLCSIRGAFDESKVSLLGK